MTLAHTSHALPPLRLLEDRARIWSKARAVLVDPEPDAGEDQPAAIGIVTWKAAIRTEVAALPALRETHAGPIVAILAGMPAARGARALTAQVQGSVLVDDLPGALVPTLQAVAAGQCVVPGRIRRLLERPPLSPRERQVLAMVVLDFTNAEIARKLVVTESNVKSHLTSAFQKLGVSSRNAAAELILDVESGLGPGILRISPDED